jgi:hypothetical protein
MNAELKACFPINEFKLAYETHAHKQVYNTNYDVCLAIPTGKKSFLWITETNECYLVDKTGVYYTKTAIKTEGLCGTVFYGTVLPQYFVLEDLYYYCGTTTATKNFKERLTLMLSALQTGFIYEETGMPEMFIVLPVMAAADNNSLYKALYWDALCKKTAYAAHHIQYRASTLQLPYLNQTTPMEVVELPTAVDYYVHYTPCEKLSLKSMAALKEAVFFVQADIQDDVYHLFAYNGKARDKKTYVDIAFIATLKDSIFMNKLFRKIRENDNVELGETSDDEDVFQDVRPDKYVDTKKTLKIKCKYLQKWRKWAPVAVAKPDAHVIPIHALCNNTNKYCCTA